MSLLAAEGCYWNLWGWKMEPWGWKVGSGNLMIGGVPWYLAVVDGKQAEAVVVASIEVSSSITLVINPG